MNSNVKNIIIGIVFIIVAFSAYAWLDHGWLKDKKDLTAGLFSNSVVSVYAQENKVSADKFLGITGLLGALKTVSLDTSFFNDPLYKSLIDSGAFVPAPTEVGRINPFAPF